MTGILNLINKKTSYHSLSGSGLFIHVISRSLVASVCILYFTGCVNLKAVHTYSTSSLKSLQKFEDLDYSFRKSCQEKCRIGQFEKQKIDPIPCPCHEEKSADSVSLIIYKALKGYFQGLADLSTNELTSYKFNALAKALKEGNFGGLTVNKQHVDAYAKISTILTRAVTDGYRRKKLSLYIGDANESVKTLLQTMGFILVETLSKRLETQEQRLQSFYFDLVEDSDASLYEKKKIIEEYDLDKGKLEVRKELVKSYARGLVSISRGHQELFENRTKLRESEVKALLAQHASDLEDIMDEWNKIKNEN